MVCQIRSSIDINEIIINMSLNSIPKSNKRIVNNYTLILLGSLTDQVMIQFNDLLSLIFTLVLNVMILHDSYWSASLLHEE